MTEQRDEQAARTALGTLLIERGFLDAERLDEALRIGAESGERLGEVVVRMGWASEDDLARTLAEQWHLRYVERSAITFDGDALRRMSRDEAAKLEALPIQVKEDGAVVVALAEPTDARFVALRELLGDRVDCVVVSKSAIDAGLRSELLSNMGGGTSAPGDSAENGHEYHQGNGFSIDAEPVPDAGRPAVAEFDDVANMLNDVLGSQLAALRAVVVEAEAGRERDHAEIERLTAELDERNRTIDSMQQKLRELADTFGRGA